MEIIELLFVEKFWTFLENAESFLNLNCAHFSCRCLPIIPDAGMNLCKHDWLRASPTAENSVPIQERFSVGRRPTARILALPALKIASLGMGRFPLF
jgi:hypothetical protein